MTHISANKCYKELLWYFCYAINLMNIKWLAYQQANATKSYYGTSIMQRQCWQKQYLSSCLSQTNRFKIRLKEKILCFMSLNRFLINSQQKSDCLIHQHLTGQENLKCIFNYQVILSGSKLNPCQFKVCSNIWFL